MEKLKKRLDDLELIANNIKLLNEMLSHYKEDSADHEKAIIEVSSVTTQNTIEENGQSFYE